MLSGLVDRLVELDQHVWCELSQPACQVELDWGSRRHSGYSGHKVRPGVPFAHNLLECETGWVGLGWLYYVCPSAAIGWLMLREGNFLMKTKKWPPFRGIRRNLVCWGIQRFDF